MGTRAAARDKDMHVCKLVRPGSPPIPHVGGPVISPKKNVFINGRPASTYGDEAECTGIKSSPPPKDSIIGGCLNVFINGKPAARISEKTYGGEVTEGSPNVFYADKVDKLSEEAANWLHQYLAQQKHIPFNYPLEGCEGRANEMTRIMQEQFGLEVKKIFVAGDMHPIGVTMFGQPIPQWNYHVAPLIEGAGTDGSAVQYVIDPSLSPDTVLTKDEWLDIAKGGGTITATKITNPNIFRWRSDGSFDIDIGYEKTERINRECSEAAASGRKADKVDEKVLSGHVAKKKIIAPPIIRPRHAE